MKSTKTLMALVAVIAAITMLTAFKSKNEKYAAGCTEWQRLSGVSIQMRWCTDDYGEVSYQFYNAYNEDVHFWYKFDCTDGRTYTGNTTLKPASESYKADMMKSKPSMWYITKKEHKDASGKWVAF